MLNLFTSTQKDTTLLCRLSLKVPATKVVATFYSEDDSLFGNDFRNPSFIRRVLPGHQTLTLFMTKIEGVHGKKP